MSKEEENKVMPELRFPDFENDGFWIEETLDKLGKLINGLTYSPDDIRQDGLLVLRSSNVQNGEIVLGDNVYVRADIKGANLSKPDDILICVRNGSKALIGKNAIIPQGMPLCTHGAFMTVFRSHVPKFVFQLFQTKEYDKQVAGDLGATINSISGSNFIKYKFFVPTNPKEQQKIAECLSSLDDLVTAENQKLDALKAHKKGLMQQLFPAEGETVPKLRFAEFRDSGEWEEKTLEKLTDKIGDGIHTTPIYDDSGKYYFINGNNLIEGKIYVDEKTKRVSEEEYRKHQKDLNDRTILLSINGTIGNVAFYHDERVILGKSACYINISKELEKIFLYYIIKSDRINNYFESELTGSTISNLSLKSIREAIINFPSKTEQQKIADCLASLDKLITAQTEKIEALKQHKKGLMQGLFPA